MQIACPDCGSDDVERGEFEPMTQDARDDDVTRSYRCERCATTFDWCAARAATPAAEGGGV